MSNDSNTQRDELAKIVSNSGVTSQRSLSRADAILAAGYRKPRTITTVEELDALPLGTIVRDGDKEPWERTDNGWRCWVYGEAVRSRDLILPATVLHEPAAEATR